jgi:hypothetical protein
LVKALLLGCAGVVGVVEAVELGLDCVGLFELLLDAGGWAM